MPVVLDAQGRSAPKSRILRCSTIVPTTLQCAERTEHTEAQSQGLAQQMSGPILCEGKQFASCHLSTSDDVRTPEQSETACYISTLGRGAIPHGTSAQAFPRFDRHQTVPSAPTLSTFDGHWCDTRTYAPEVVSAVSKCLAHTDPELGEL